MEELKCEICGKTKGRIIKSRMYNKMLCQKHYNQLYVYNKIYKTQHDLNEIVIYDNFAEIYLYKSQKRGIDSEVKSKAIIDLDDVEKIKNIKWYCNKYGYVTADKNSKHGKLYLHRFILNYNGDLVVDHINNNSLDNRKSNLRACEQIYNSINRTIQNNNTSGVVGISWNKEKNMWEVYITLNRKCKKLGYFKDFEKAKYTRYKAEIEYFKEFTNNREFKLRFIQEYEGENNYAK